MARMALYPAIELMAGRVTRSGCDQEPLARDDGDADDDPIAAARRFRDAGAEWLHVVDLDGALAGEPKHLDIVRAIAATGIAPQLTGGLCSEDAVAAAFAAGARRVVLGAETARVPEMLAGCLARWSDRIGVSLDARGGQVTAAGWLEVLSESVVAFATRMARVGVRTLVLTHVERNATLAGGDNLTLEGLRMALPETTLVAAGQITSLDDVRWLATSGLDGAILGRPYFAAGLDLAGARRAVAEVSDMTEPQMAAESVADASVRPGG